MNLSHLDYLEVLDPIGSDEREDIRRAGRRFRRRRRSGVAFSTAAALACGVAVAVVIGDRSGPMSLTQTPPSTRLTITTPTPALPATSSPSPARAEPTSGAPSTQSLTIEPSRSHVPQQTSTATAAEPLIAAPLRFTFDVVVSGRTVTISGRWTGVDRALTAAQIAADEAPSTGSVAGSGVEGFDGAYDAVDGGSSENRTSHIFAQTNGDILTCTGAAVEQTRTLPPRRITLTKAGTYQLTMTTYSCAGQRVDTSTFSVR